MATDKFVTVGRLGRTRGVEGELYIAPMTDFPDRFLDMEEIHVLGPAGWEKFRIESSRLVGDRPVIKFDGYDTREDAARLTNRDLAVPIDKVVELPDDSYYIYDLVGCRVYEDGTDRPVGELVDVKQYPANDVYVIRTDDGKEALVPAVREFVKEVDLEQRRIIIVAAGMVSE